MKPMKSYSLTLSNEAVKTVRTNPCVRLYQKKFDGPNKVRFFTNRPDSLTKDLALALGGTVETFQKQLGIQTAEEKKAILEEKAKEVQKRNIKRQMNAMIKQAKARGIDISNLI